MGQKDNQKIGIFLDADDTILNSSEVVIDILNSKYNITPKKTYDDLSDWGYRSIYPSMTKKDILDIYDSDAFFEKVKINDLFLDFYENHKDDFKFVIVTKGTPVNIKKKKELFKKKIPNAEFVGCELDFYNQNFSKQNVDMKFGIQIDDRCDCLDTNANIKILYTHSKKFKWNNPKDCGIENRYDCKDWSEIIAVLNFFVNNQNFLEAPY